MLDVYCKWFNYTTTVTGIVFGTLSTASFATAANYSQLVVYVGLDTGTNSGNYVVSTQSGGGFNVSTSIIDTVSAGAHWVQACVEGRGLTGAWTANYSVSVLQ